MINYYMKLRYYLLWWTNCKLYLIAKSKVTPLSNRFTPHNIIYPLPKYLCMIKHSFRIDSFPPGLKMLYPHPFFLSNPLFQPPPPFSNLSTVNKTPYAPLPNQAHTHIKHDGSLGYPHNTLLPHP